MAAQSPVRSERYLGARYRYLRAKLGGLKAVKAMARVLACLYYPLVTKGQVWVDRGTAEFEQRRQQRDLATRAAQSPQPRPATGAGSVKLEPLTPQRRGQRNPPETETQKCRPK
jgi:hypothetical protein